MSGNADRPLTFEGDAPFLAKAAGVVAAVTIVLYQAWFMPFFQPFFAGREAFARIVFYALYGSLVLVSGAVLGTRADIRRKVVPFAVVAVVGLAATALHPIGLVTRAYIIAIVIGGATMVLMLASASSALLQLSAAITALNSVLCLVDLLFTDGFTNTVGRAAGLAINPNVAAAAILLGAAASYRAVSRRLQVSFLVLTAGSLAVTMSRSTILAAAAAAVIPAAVEIWRRVRARRPLWPRLEGVRPAAWLAVGIAAWITLAAVTNSYVRPAIHTIVTDSLSFAAALGDAHRSVADVTRGAPPPGDSPAESPTAATGVDATPSGAAPGRSDASRIAALDVRLSSEGGRNTISARTLFLERALLVYRNSGFVGAGLEKAQALVPHNTFVLFALAFGHLGWFIPLSVIALALYAARDARDLPLTVAAVGTMVTSHDIFLTPSLFLPIAIGIGAMIARGPAPGGDRRVRRAIMFASAGGVLLFAVGCLVILRFSPRLTVERLNPETVIEYQGAYLTNLPMQIFPGVFVPAAADPRNAAAFFREDTRSLTHVALNPSAYPPVGPGEYAVYGGVLIFLPSDAADPRTGDHILELGLPHKIGTSFYGLLAALAAWCMGLILFGRGRTIRRAAADRPRALH